ncbi:phosphotransferase [Bacillus sp. Marseille-P3800]|uniref:phosphotransferase n=1 Tax=Bacillus sp. Marseille-P3800 TaxID=2014782 RepID=UPI00159BCF19|nr:phosphotransferase [Bacillus sp. Marseille-P3800]
MNEHQWKQTLHQINPSLTINLLTVNDTGWDHTIVTVNNDTVFRFPKKPDSEALLRKEWSFVRAIQRTKFMLPVPKLSPVYDEAILIALAYPLIDGIPLHTVENTTTLSQHDFRKLGHFLSAIHGINPSELEGFEHLHTLTFWSELYSSLQAEVYPFLDANLTVHIDHVFQDFLNQFDTTYRNYQNVPIHGDLTTSNMIYSPEDQKLAGIIDFTDAQLGDPAFDFAGLYWAYGSDLVQQILNYYQTNLSKEDMLYRIEHFYGLQPLFHHLLYLQKHHRLDEAHPAIERFLVLKDRRFL